MVACQCDEYMKSCNETRIKELSFSKPEWKNFWRGSKFFGLVKHSRMHSTLVNVV